MPIQTEATHQSSTPYHVAMRDDYNAHSIVQRFSVDSSRKSVERGVEAYSALDGGVEKDAARLITIADFGSSVGANSSRAVSFVIEALRARFGFEATKSILVIHNDLPHNSWPTLFDYVNADPTSYAAKFDGVFSVASGKSFYQQVLPTNSLHFGYSNMALQWLSELPVKVSDHCFVMLAGSAEEKALFKKVADRDFRDFLRARSAELVNGGVLVFHCLATKYSQDTMIKSKLTADGLYLSAKRLCEQGLISADELLNFNVQIYVRDVSDVTDSALLESFGFEIISCELINEDCQNPLYKSYKAHQNLERYAVESSGIMEAGLEPNFVHALDASRSPDDKKRICSALWEEYRGFIRKNPEEFNFTASQLYVVLRKV